MIPPCLCNLNEVVALRPHTDLSLFLLIRHAVYVGLQIFERSVKSADLPERVQEAPPQPYTPSRWFAFWVLSWEADEERLSLLWWACLIPQLDVM